MRERAAGLPGQKAWEDFASDVATTAQALRATLGRLKSKGHALAGYGATAKSSVALSYCGIGRDLLDCIFDTTPAKIGLFSPCDAIPIAYAEPNEVARYHYLVAFAWNFLPEIEQREHLFRAAGGK